jgi:post-segregation antitoxin (ccd killing protein)
LFRVYSPAKAVSLTEGTVDEDYRAIIKELEAKVSATAKEAETLRTASESWETMAHSWRVQTEAMTKLLTYDKEPGLFSRIFK